MASPPSQALTKRNAESALMPPPPAPKRIKRPSQVVDEDVYTDALSHIIARDFFPGLLESEAQQEYMQALDSNNNDWIRDAGRKLHQAMTPGPRARRGTSLATSASQTPRGWQGATPSRTPSVAPSTVASEASRSTVDTSLSLGAFQAKYTSEDNESFNALLDRQNQKRAKKYAYMYNGNKLPSKQQIAQQKLLAQNAAAPSTALFKRPSQDLDARRASYDSFPNRQGPRNTFMFDPEGVEDTHETVAQAAQKASVAPPKAISYTSTRLPTASSSETESQIPASPSISAIDAAIAGRPRPSDTSTTAYSGAETPRVNGYAFVDATPLPHEYPGQPVSEAQVEAEERASALALLPPYDPDADNNPFKLQAASKREEIHHRLVEKSNAARRKPGGGGRLDFLRGEKGQARTPTPKFATSPAVGGRTPGVGNMTPAARALAQRIGGTPGRSGGLFGGSSKSWTPTPRVKKPGV